MQWDLFRAFLNAALLFPQWKQIANFLVWLKVQMHFFFLFLCLHPFVLLEFGISFLSQISFFNRIFIPFFLITAFPSSFPSQTGTATSFGNNPLAYRTLMSSECWFPCKLSVLGAFPVWPLQGNSCTCLHCMSTDKLFLIRKMSAMTVYLPPSHTEPLLITAAFVSSIYQ